MLMPRYLTLCFPVDPHICQSPTRHSSRFVHFMQHENPLVLPAATMPALSACIYTGTSPLQCRSPSTAALGWAGIPLWPQIAIRITNSCSKEEILTLLQRRQQPVCGRRPAWAAPGSAPGPSAPELPAPHPYSIVTRRCSVAHHRHSSSVQHLDRQGAKGGAAPSAIQAQALQHSDTCCLTACSWARTCANTTAS